MRLPEHQVTGNHDAGLLRQLIGIVTTLLLGGCLATPPTRIEADNTGVTQRAIRATFSVNDGNRPASETQSGHAIEIGYQSTSISSNQSLSSGQQPVKHNGSTFYAPNQLRNDFDFSYADISWRMREFAGGPIGMELFSGLAQSTLGLTVTSPTQHAYQNFNTTGLQLGFGLIWRSSPVSSLHVRGSYYWSFDKGVDDATQYELYYAHAFHKNLSLHVGYSDWQVNGFGEDGMSDFHMHFAGPTLILEGAFNLSD